MIRQAFRPGVLLALVVLLGLAFTRVQAVVPTTLDVSSSL